MRNLISALHDKYPKHKFKWKIHNNVALGLCPEHDDIQHPSFEIFKGKNGFRYYCFACNFSGNINNIKCIPRTADEIKRFEINKLAEHYATVFNKLLTDNTNGYKYLQERIGNNPDNIISKFQIGYIPKNYKCCDTPLDILETKNNLTLSEKITLYSSYYDCIVFIYRNTNNEITQFNLRQPFSHNFVSIKILDNGVFNSIDIIKYGNSPIVWIVEGEFDVLTTEIALQQYHENIIGIGSTSNLSLGLIKFILDCNKIPVISLDYDNAGKAAINKLVLNGNNMDNVYMASITGYEAKDFDELFEDKQIDEVKHIFSTMDIISLKDYYNILYRQEQEKIISKYKNFPDNMKNIIYKANKIDNNNCHLTTPISELSNSIIDDAESIIDGTYETQTIETGFVNLDFILGGYEPNSLNIIAARPSIGKTALALNIALNISRSIANKVVFLSLEMSNKQLRNRLISNITGKYYKAILRNIEQSKEAKEMLDEFNLVINDNAVQDANTIKQLMLENKPKVLIIDYLQLMNVGKAETRNLAVGDITRQLKIMAKQFNCIIILLSQLSRAVEMRNTQEPQLSDLRDSGSIEQDSDTVCFLYKNKNANDQVICKIAKNREGAMGKVEFLFDGKLSRYSEIEEELNK